MTYIPLTGPCSQPAGHSDWAAYLLGYLRGVDDVETRRLILKALEHADAAHGLPPFAQEIRQRLAVELADEDVSPF